MQNKGLIWNNDLPSWSKIRGCFQHSLNVGNIQKAVSVIEEVTVDLIDESKSITGFVDMMEICRRLTFRATLSVFFGINAREFLLKGINEIEFIKAIVNYFKAWEYFLFRPKEYWDAKLDSKHSAAIRELQSRVKRMLTSIGDESSSSSGSDAFIFQLRDVCKDYPGGCEDDALVQSALEMMLAGTDTSSVTAYYAILGLAADYNLQSDLRNDMASTKNPLESKLLRSIVDETLRIKPVGPVVLREAVEDDPMFPGIAVKKGDAFLIHLADMNLLESNWSIPKAFCPRRFLVSNGVQSHQHKFFPFGNGPKGCIGMHLGRSEVNTIVHEVITNYRLDIAAGDSTICALKMNWDIANQPENPTLIKVGKYSVQEGRY